MASARQALMLAFTVTVFAAARAPAQPVAPPPLSPPDPASVLLDPVETTPGPTKPGLDLPPDDVQVPLPPPGAKPAPAAATPAPAATTRRAAWLEPVPGDAPLDRKDFEDSLRKPAAAPARPASDPFDYLSGGKLRRENGALVRTDKPWDVDTGGGPRGAKKFGDGLRDGYDRAVDGGKDWLGGHNWFCQDRDFDCFISPLTNPFLFEDPRSITEVRPLVLLQGIPSGNPYFQGGHTNFFGLQGRLAVTERLSVTINKLGFQSLAGSGGSPQGNSLGLAELWLGPKYELYRNPDTQTLVSIGGIFQIPLGSGSVYQNTGRLSIVPYVSAAQRLLDTDYGRLNGMATAGYSISTNSARSDYFYLSGHLDFDVLNRHRFFPLVEVNWFSVTTNGRANPQFDFEGRDAINFGANAKGNNLVTLALGAKYRFTDRWTVGAAYEFRAAGPRDVFQRRFTLDLSWRY